MTSRIFHLPPLRLIAGLAAFVLAGAIASAQDATATSGFNPAQVGPEEVSQYEVTVSESGSSSTPKGDLPKVDGLDVVGSSTSNSIRIVNGEMSTDFGFHFSVRAVNPGQYMMPAFNVTVNGKTLTVPAATLTVTNQPTTAGAASNTPGAAAITGNSISLTAKPSRTDIYVGEKLPLDLTLTWRPDMQPQLNGEFAQDNDSFERVDISGKPREYNVAMNGQSYGAASWNSSLTPIKAGPQSLSFTMPLLVNIPSQNGGDPMTAILMGSMPNMFTQQQSLNLVSAPLNLNVMPLPAEGRPANFSGAIGNFSINPPDLSSTDLQVGVPVTFKLTITGQGNFDRLQAPALDLGTLWRSYTPKETFTAKDSIGYEGEKTFQYVIMPMSDAITQLPVAQFNYFNPDTKAYVELPTQPIPVTVKPAPPGQAPIPLPVVASTPGETTKPELIGLHADAGEWQSPQPSLILASPYFWASQAAPALIFAALFVTRRRQLRLENDPLYARRLRARQQAHAAVERARAAAAQGRAAEFYAVAQRALQEAATQDRLDAAEALTWQEFDAHLAQRGASVQVRQQAREIFDAGDALRFGGFTPDQADLTAAATRLDGLVKQLLEHA